METATVIDCARIWEHGRVVERDIHNAGESAVSRMLAKLLEFQNGSCVQHDLQDKKSSDVPTAV
jgi:hypothetical protein